MTTVLLLRHGRTGANTAGVLAGRSAGVELDEVGRRQVAEVAQALAPVPLAAVVSSPLRRCRQTAQAVVAAREAPLPLSTEQGLTECGYGAWTGRKLADLSKEKLWQTVQRQPSAVRFPDGESMREMSVRAVEAVRRWDASLAERSGPHAVWVAVSHGDVIKAILADALGMHLDAFQRILVNPASVSVISYTDTRPYVVTMNSTTTDFRSLIPPPPAKRRRSKARTETSPESAPVDPGFDAPVGGGLGSAEPR